MRGMEQRIVITDLLQMSHPGYRLVKNNRMVTDRELPTLLDYATLVYDRFKFYVNRESYNNLEYDTFLSDIVKSLKTLSEEDDPVLLIRVYIVVSPIIDAKIAIMAIEASV